MLGACASESKIIDPTPDINLLPGEYKITIVEDDLKRINSPNFNGQSFLGNWIVKLSEDGSFAAYLNGKEMAVGNYIVKGSKIEIGIRSVCDQCDCDENIGRYYWNVNKDKLAFSLDYDLCEGEVILLTSHPLERIK